MYANGFTGGDVYAPERKATERLLREVHEEFMGVFSISAHNTGWRDGCKFESISEFVAREARRAVADALPMLQCARHAQLVEIADAKDKRDASARLDDVAAWLARHKIRASITVALANPDDPDQLGAIATELRATLVVAGAYGHSRLQQWMMGGVTRNLLVGVQRCSLVSH